MARMEHDSHLSPQLERYYIKKTKSLTLILNYASYIGQCDIENHVNRLIGKCPVLLSSCASEKKILRKRDMESVLAVCLCALRSKSTTSNVKIQCVQYLSLFVRLLPSFELPKIEIHHILTNNLNCETFMFCLISALNDLSLELMQTENEKNELIDELQNAQLTLIQGLYKNLLSLTGNSTQDTVDALLGTVKAMLRFSKESISVTEHLLSCNKECVKNEQSFKSYCSHCFRSMCTKKKEIQLVDMADFNEADWKHSFELYDETLFFGLDSSTVRQLWSSSVVKILVEICFKLLIDRRIKTMSAHVCRYETIIRLICAILGLFIRCRELIGFEDHCLNDVLYASMIEVKHFRQTIVNLPIIDTEKRVRNDFQQIDEHAKYNVYIDCLLLKIGAVSNNKLIFLMAS